MIKGSQVYQVLEAMAPLYTSAALGYASVRWFRVFSSEQCAGINRFVALYAVPALIFEMVSTNDIYKMNGRLVAADTLQKVALLLGLAAWALWERSRCRERGGAKPWVSSPLQWVVTCCSVAALPNAIVIGVALLSGLYGPVAREFVKQIVVMQFCIWYNVVIFLYEYMAAARRASSAPAPGGSARISPSPPVEAVAAENGAGSTNANGASNIAAERPQELAVNIENTELATAAAPAARDGLPDGTAKTTSEEVSAPAPSMKQVVWMAVKKVLQIPNTYASLLGIFWALISFKYGIVMPKIIADSLFTIRTTAVGLGMFSSGMFIARQSRLVPCGYKTASFAMILKFLVGPVAMLLASLAVGIHGTFLRIVVVQAALPLSLTSFVYAEEYKVYPDIMSTGVILAMFISLPVAILYSILLEL